MTNLPDNFKRAIVDLQRRNAEAFQLLAGILADRQAGVPEALLVPRAKELHRLAAECRRDYLRLQADVIDWELTTDNIVPDFARENPLQIPDFLPESF